MPPASWQHGKACLLFMSAHHLDYDPQTLPPVHQGPWVVCSISKQMLDLRETHLYRIRRGRPSYHQQCQPAGG